MAITREQIFQACDSIFSQGKTPRIESIRTLLGSGSYSTIGKYLKEWKEQNPDSANVSIIEIPQDLQNAAYEAIKPLLGIVWDKATETINSERIKTLEIENERYQQQTQELAGLRTAYDSLIARNEQLNQDLALARAGVGVEDANTFLKLESELETVKQERDKFIKQSGSLTKELQEALTDNTVLHKRVDSLEAERKTLAEQCQLLKVQNAEISILQERLKEKDEMISYLEKQIPAKGIAPLVVDNPNDLALIEQLNAARAEIERLNQLNAELEQQQYLASLSTAETGAEIINSEQFAPTHHWAVGDTFKKRSELKSQFKLSERDARKHEIDAPDGSKWRRLSETESIKLAKQSGERLNTIFYKCVG